MPSLEDGTRALALPVPPRRPPVAPGRPAPEAWLVAIKDSGPLSDFDRLTLHQAVTIVALELLRGRVAGDTERRLAGDVLAAVVRGELAGVELARRLEPFGLAEQVAALVLAAPASRGAGARAEAALHGACARRRRARWSPPPGSSPARWSPASTRTSCSRSPSAWRPRRARARCPVRLGVGRAVRRRRRPPQLPRGRAVRWRPCRLAVRRPERQRQRHRGPPAGRSGHLPRPRLLPAAALAPGRRGAASCSATRSLARSRPARATTAVS